MKRISIFFIMIFVSVVASAMNCRVAQMLNHPSISSNDEFWNEFGKLEKPDDRTVEALIQKYSTAATAPASFAAKVAPLVDSFTLSHKAEKAQAKLNPINQKHFDEFIKVINEKGPQGLYEQPKKWHFEKLKVHSEQHTVRLDSGYRVLFEVKDGTVHVLDIGNHITH